jgi:hypothetical protein
MINHPNRSRKITAKDLQELGFEDITDQVNAEIKRRGLPEGEIDSARAVLELTPDELAESQIRDEINGVRVQLGEFALHDVEIDRRLLWELAARLKDIADRVAEMDYRSAT